MLNPSGQISGKPNGDAALADAAHPTFTGNRALQQEEPLIFETGRTDVTGVDIDEPAPSRRASAGWSARRRSACPA